MAKLTIWVGREKPLTAVGKNQVTMLGFAEHAGANDWHSFASDRATVAAIKGLARRGAIRVNWEARLYKLA